METPVQLDFQGIEAKPDLRSAVGRQISQLEERFGRVTAGRIVLKGPSGHHRNGGLYEINIRLALPEGREVNIGRTPQSDERHADLSFALETVTHPDRKALAAALRAAVAERLDALEGSGALADRAAAALRAVGEAEGARGCYA